MVYYGWLAEHLWGKQVQILTRDGPLTVADLYRLKDLQITDALRSIPTQETVERSGARSGKYLRDSS